jgi:small subunit ribosomal protein S4e
MGEYALWARGGGRGVGRVRRRGLRRSGTRRTGGLGTPCWRSFFFPLPPSFYLPDVISIEKSGEHFRLLYDIKGRFAIHRITAEEATYKLLKVKKVQLGAKGVPFLVSHDGRTIRYPDPAIKVNDTVKFDLVENKIVDFTKFEAGNLAMAIAGRNMGRVGVIVHTERHLGGFDIVTIRDVLDRTFATR